MITFTWCSGISSNYDKGKKADLWWLGMVWGEGWATKGHRGNFWSDGSILHLAWGGDYMLVFVEIHRTV